MIVKDPVVEQAFSSGMLVGGFLGGLLGIPLYEALMWAFKHLTVVVVK